MATAALVLAAFVALQHVGFMALEMYFWNKPLGLKVFKRTQAQADESFSLAKNQGLYNGFLAAGLLWGLIAEPEFGWQIRLFFLSCVVSAGLFGAATASFQILFIQALPAAIALGVNWMARWS